MTSFKVLNVGQGDCIVIRPQDHCCFKDDVFFVDVGSGNRDVTKEIREDDKVHLILTHHHSDHINGLKYFFNNFKQVKDITVPYCYNEINLMAQAILNLKGIKSARNCSELVKLLTDVIDDRAYLKTVLEKNTSIKINLAYDGYKLCNHMNFLNPHMDTDFIDRLDETQENEFRELAMALFEESFASNLIHYVAAVKNGHGFDHFFSQSFIYNHYYENEEYPGDRIIAQSKAGCAIVVGYILNNYKIFQDFNRSPGKYLLQKIYDNYKQNTHDVCLVMKAFFRPELSVLLTGDASKNVFNRLMANGEDIRSYYLKVPHHGSKNNLNKSILQAIAPRVAIISHNNGLFGRAIDPHPNKPVVDLLENMGIDIALTNDVIKKGLVCLSKTPFNDGYLEVE